MNIKGITWPIYAIGVDHKVYEDMNVLYVDHNGMTSVLDNKNLSGNTLGSRRLKLKKENLYHLKRTLFMFAELLEYTRTKRIIDRYFIDSKGILFLYTKKVFKPLIWRKIVKVETFGSYVLLYVEGILQRFEIPNNYWNKFKEHNNVFIGLLKFNSYYVLYDLDIKKHNDTRRKV